MSRKNLRRALLSFNTILEETSVSWYERKRYAAIADIRTLFERFDDIYIIVKQTKELIAIHLLAIHLDSYIIAKQ